MSLLHFWLLLSYFCVLNPVKGIIFAGPPRFTPLRGSNRHNLAEDILSRCIICKVVCLVPSLRVMGDTSFLQLIIIINKKISFVNFVFKGFEKSGRASAA